VSFKHDLLTLSIHVGFKASLESTGSTLIPMCLVDGTFAIEISLCFTGINTVPVDTSLEEARAAYNTSQHDREACFGFFLTIT